MLLVSAVHWSRHEVTDLPLMALNSMFFHVVLAFTMSVQEQEFVFCRWVLTVKMMQEMGKPFPLRPLVVPIEILVRPISLLDQPKCW